VNIPSAVGGGNTRIDRVVLRADWANFNVSVYRIAGVDAAVPSAPVIVQTSGTTYDIMLCQALVDTGGTVTVTDERVWASSIVIARQGGGATDWDDYGSTNYMPGQSIIQTGCIAVAVAGAGELTFPIPFLAVPFVSISSVLGIVIPQIIAVTATTLHVHGYGLDGNRADAVINWIAIGPT
jgi:hypothetical protein